ncbi:MAG: helix-turn-helix transcriptional regulator [Clostridia bacterium]|nr:helix-turn-helix transcriptional regulator [Clostridia bacterium]
MSKIGNRILALRKQANLTQQELANKVGYKSKSAINKIELGLRDISQSKIILFANALNVNPAELLGLETQNQDESELITLIERLTEEETEELSRFVDYLISKRK